MTERSRTLISLLAALGLVPATGCIEDPGESDTEIVALDGTVLLTYGDFDDPTDVFDVPDSLAVDDVAGEQWAVDEEPPTCLEPIGHFETAARRCRAAEPTSEHRLDQR